MFVNHVNIVFYKQLSQTASLACATVDADFFYSPSATLTRALCKKSTVLREMFQTRNETPCMRQNR